VKRILAKAPGILDLEPDLGSHTLRLFISAVLSLFADLLSRLYWSDPWGITKHLQRYATEVIEKLIGIDNERWNSSTVMNLIQLLATKTDRFEVTFKWRP